MALGTTACVRRPSPSLLCSSMEDGFPQPAGCYYSDALAERLGKMTSVMGRTRLVSMKGSGTCSCDRGLLERAGARKRLQRGRGKLS